MRGEGTVRDLTATGPLILVNAAHPLRTLANPELAELEGGVLLERRAAAALRACLRAVGGTSGILPVSGWRSRPEQQAIWDDTLAKEGQAFTQSYVAMPDCSEHQTGLAIDLGRRQENVDFIRPYFPDEGVCRAFRLAGQQGLLCSGDNCGGVVAASWRSTGR